MTAESKSALRYGLDLTKRHGTYVLVSQPPELNIPFRELIFKNVAIVGTLQGNGQDLQDVMDFVVEKGVEVVTRTWGLEDIGTMWDAQENGTQVGKNVVLF